MASYNKFNQFATDLCEKVHNLNSDVLKVALTNSAPVATNTVLANITEITASNGYTAGGIDTTASLGAASGTVTITGTNTTWTSVTGNMGPFQYVVLYNTSTSPVTKPLIGWWDYGSALTLNGVNGDTFTVKFNGGASTGTMFTVA